MSHMCDLPSLWHGSLPWHQWVSRELHQSTEEGVQPRLHTRVKVLVRQRYDWLLTSLYPDPLRVPSLSRSIRCQGWEVTLQTGVQAGRRRSCARVARALR